MASDQSQTNMGSPSDVQSIPTVSPNPFGDLSAGLQTGIQLAAMQEQIQQRRDMLDMQKQEHQTNSAIKFLDAVDKGYKLKGPAQKAAFKVAEQVAPMAGIQLGPDAFALPQSQDEAFGAVLSNLMADPAGTVKDPQRWGQVQQMFSGDVTSAVKAVQGFHATQQQNYRAQLMATSGAENAQTRAAVQGQIAGQKADLEQQKINQTGNLANRGLDIKQQVADQTQAFQDRIAQIRDDVAQGNLTNQQALADMKKEMLELQKQLVPSIVKKNEAGAEATTSNATEKIRHDKATEGIAATRAQKAGTTSEGTAEARLQRIHQRYLGTVQKDPILLKTATQYNTLDRAINNVKNSPNVTPQLIDDLQQAIRNNIVSGGMSAEERKNTYQSNLGLTVERAQQWLTSSPASIASDNATVHHLLDVADLEKKQVSKFADKRLGVVSQGAASFYSKHPDLKQDFLGTTGATQGQFGGGAATPATPTGQLKVPSPAFLQQLTPVFKGDTGRLKTYLQGKGYDASGVK